MLAQSVADAEPAAQSTQTVQVRKPIPERIVPMIERTRPAVAIPEGAPTDIMSFLALPAQIIPAIPQMSAIRLAKLSQKKTTETIPRTNEAIAIPRPGGF